MEEVLLIKLGEIVLKGLNRKTFEQVCSKISAAVWLPAGNLP